MTKSTICLPDVNVWLALITRRHVHNVRAVSWFEGMGAEGSMFCRITQMGVLRLLSNRTVMGEDVLNASRAWHVYDQILLDSRVGFTKEPATLEQSWRLQTEQAQGAPSNWTDAYLAAFAKEHRFKVVTFDKQFPVLEGLEVVVLD